MWLVMWMHLTAGLLETKHIPHDEGHALTETRDINRISVFPADRLLEC
jgi:hypothetical protein